MKIRLTGAVLVAAVLPAAASAAQITPTLRVEGGSANVVPLTPFGVESSAKTTVIVRDTTDPDTISVSARSATAHVAEAASRLGLSLGFDIFNFGGPSAFITQIGPDKMPVSFSPSWRLKVNHKVTPSGSDATNLKPTDAVLWSFGASFDAPELDLRTAKQQVALGTLVRARVFAFDNDGLSIPATGALVYFGGTAKRADGAGAVSFTAAGAGAFWVSATRPGSVRSQRQLVCVRPAGIARLCSAVTSPKPAGRVTAPQAVTGVVAGAVPQSRVTVSLAKLVGSKCRFLTSDRRTFAAPRACGSPIAISLAVTSKSNWTLRLASKQSNVRGRLSPGRYRVWSRVTAGPRRETQGTPGINTVTFTVVPKGVYG